MQQFTALISDLDGTLVNTEPIHLQAWLEVVGRYGLSFGHDWFDPFVGTSDVYVAQDLIQHHGIQESARGLQNEKQVAFHALVRSSGSLLFEGLPPLLAAIAANFPTAIATNSGRADAEVIFAGSGLAQYFPSSVTASDVQAMKPDPEMYLLAARQIQVAPSQVLVCEDSPAGIAGAKAAGCYVLGIKSSQPATKLAAADEIFDHPAAAFRRVLDLLK